MRSSSLLIAPMFVALCLPVFAVDGVVINITTGRPQPGVQLSLVQPSANGMVPLGNATSGPKGEFKIDKQIPPGPGLLQATYQGTTYNQIITPNMPTTGVQVKIYDSTKDPVAARVAEHLILMEPNETGIKISETFVFLNTTTASFNDPVKGSLQFYLPPGADGKAQAIITAPGGMPIARTPTKAAQPNFYKVDYPVKPGETRMDINYAVPAAPKFTGKIVPSAAGTHLVTPFSVTLTGDGIEYAGQEPKTQAHIYNVNGLEYNVLIEGAGALRAAPAEDSGEDNGSPKIVISPARIYSKQLGLLGAQVPIYLVVLTLAFGILALGGFMLYRRGTV